MAKIFRKLRLEFLQKESFKKYLLYALGEILLVVIGILLALQINASNENRKNRKSEKILLNNFIADLESDITAFDHMMFSTGRKMKLIDSLFLMLKNPASQNLQSLIRYNFDIPTVDVFHPTSGTYDEAISTGKMALIRGEQTRKRIFTHYRNLAANGTDGVTNKFIEEVVFPEWGELVFPSSEVLDYFQLENNMPPLDISSLSKNKKYVQLIAQKYATQAAQIENWQELKTTTQDLLDHINEELNLK